MDKYKKINIFALITLIITLIASSTIYGVNSEPLMTKETKIVSDTGFIFPGETVNYTATIRNESQIFMLRLNGATLDFPVNGDYFDFVVGSTTLDHQSVPDSYRIDSVNHTMSMGTFPLSDIKPGGLTEIGFSGTVNDNAQPLLEQGLPIKVNYEYYDMPPSIPLNVEAKSEVVDGVASSYKAGDRFVEKITIKNNNLDQLTAWSIEGTLPNGLIVEKIYDETGILNTPNSEQFSVSGNYINGSDVWLAEGTKVNDSTEKEVFFEILVANSQTSQNVDLPFGVKASTAHDQYTGEFNEQLIENISLISTGNWVVTYYGNENTSGNVPIDNQQYATGATVTVQENVDLEKTGHSFKGWSDEPNGSVKYESGTTFSISENTDLYAVWEPIYYTVTFEPSGGTINTNSITVLYGSLLSNPHITRSGYSFRGWFDLDAINGEKQWNFSLDKVTNNITLTAKWVVENSGSDPEPTPKPTPEPTPEPTAEPTPEPTPKPTLEPKETPTETPTSEPTDESTEEPTLEPTPPLSTNSFPTQTKQLPAGMEPTTFENVYQLINEDGVPLGYYMPVTKEDGSVEWIEVNEDGTPLGALKINPTTGENKSTINQIVILFFSFVVIALFLRLKRYKAKN